MTRSATTRAAARPTRPVDPKYAELGSFLAARRAEVTPQQVGLPGGGARRLPGLRREEVAMLAGIGASWYAWIEQGRAKNVSPEILEAIAGVLDLDEAQLLYVLRLAGYAATGRPRIPIGDLELTRKIVDEYLPNPAYVIDRYWDITAANASAERLLGIGGERPNYLEMLFDREAAGARFPRWECDASDAVARFRAQAGELLHDARMLALIDYLREESPEFVVLWARHHVTDGSSTTQVVHHPDLGELSFTRIAFDFTSQSGLQLILLSPHAGTGTAEKLSRWGHSVAPATLAPQVRLLSEHGVPA
ncbi:helix-turn-helix domain-containing protein [Streptomyces sp. NPDC006879]|uniref:helix-turn-helix domain-containing protein n=1 Tax=Streptomyces sp. NPDC006879 TaxID=3364767 RepID=UPI003693BA45